MSKIKNLAQYLPIRELYELEHNPRTISKKNFEILKESVKNNPDFFEAHPIIASDRTGKNVVIAGNQRLRACRALEMDEAPVVVLHGLSEEQEREIIIRSNVENGEWDMDLLANEWDSDELAGWGVGIPEDWLTQGILDEILDVASEKTITEYNESSDYDLSNMVRAEVNPDIMEKLEKSVANGKVRPEIEKILRKRAEQCAIFNFDEIIKFYRSQDASEEEKELLRRLYLVYITPREAFEDGMLKIERITGEIYDETILEKSGEAVQ